MAKDGGGYLLANLSGYPVEFSCGKSQRMNHHQKTAGKSLAKTHFFSVFSTLVRLLKVATNFASKVHFHFCFLTCQIITNWLANLQNNCNKCLVLGEWSGNLGDGRTKEREKQVDKMLRSEAENCIVCRRETVFRCANRNYHMRRNVPRLCLLPRIFFCQIIFFSSSSGSPSPTPLFAFNHEIISQQNV